MSEKCVLCGLDLVDGVCPNLVQHIKPMCLNCVSCSPELNTDSDALYCNNPENKKDAMNKLLQSVPSGYQLTSFELKPLPLKDCTKRCKRWEFTRMAVEQLVNMLQPVEQKQ